MAKKLKFKTGDSVIYKRGVGGFSKPTEHEAIILLAEKLRRHNLPPYIIRTKNFDTFALERDLRLKS